MCGDAAYRGISPKIVTPYVGRNLPQEQFKFNFELAKIRQVVERTIGEQC